MTEREEYMIEQMGKEKLDSIPINLPTNLISELEKLADAREMTLDELILTTLTDKIIDDRIKDNKQKFENVTDVFEFYRLEDLMDENKTYFVANPLGKDVVMLPFTEEYKELSKFMKENS